MDVLKLNNAPIYVDVRINKYISFLLTHNRIQQKQCNLKNIKINK